MTINVDEKLNENLLKSLLELAVLIEKCHSDEIFQHRFNKTFKNDFIAFGKTVWNEYICLNNEIQKTFVKNTYKLPNGSEVDINKFNQRFETVL
jgi:hypothetical protein